MRKARKKFLVVEAYRLGDPNDEQAINELIAKGAVRLREAGVFEVFSQESRDGKGEIAYVGDYIKLDSSGHPYPNKADFFEKNHRHISGAYYEQRSEPVYAWLAEDGICPEIRFLMEQKHLTLNKRNPEKYFQAPLWGAHLSAAKNAVLIFYRIERDEAGDVMDAEFNFVERNEFEKTYEFLLDDEVASEISAMGMPKDKE